MRKRQLWKTGRRVKIWWVDDDHSNPESNQARLLRLLSRNPVLVLKGIPPTELEQLISQPTVRLDMFLVDYRLNSVPDEHGRRFPFTGTALVGPLRDTFPERPIYLVSGLISADQAREDTELFDRLLVQEQLTEPEGQTLLICDAQDYRRIREVRDRASVGPLNILLKTPTSNRELIITALPDDLRDGIGEATGRGRKGLELTYRLPGAIRFARWVQRVLLRLPGILYDDLFAATFLGMSLRYFTEKCVRKVERTQLKENPLYTGIFADTMPRHWWKSSLNLFVYSLPGARHYPVSKTWEVCPEILKLPKRDLPRCQVCGELYPETVGYDRDNPLRRAPVHWRCSEPDPTKQPVPQFEQIRWLKE